MIFDRSAFQGSYCRLCAVKFFLSNNTLMGIVYNYPVLTVNPNHMGMTDPVTSMLPIDNPAHIPFIPQDAINQTARPKVFVKQIVPFGAGTPSRPLVKHGSRYALRVELPCKLFLPLAVRRHAKNTPHRLRRLRVYHKAASVSRVLDVTIGSKRGKKVSLLGAETLCAPHLPGQVPAV